ncbi:MAG: DUF418 domain-containing protein [Rhodobacterales bacterium]|nr:DUF418 domain-containing protein [Rhodobacterales bacterium]
MHAPIRNTSVDLIRTAALVGICVVNFTFLGLPIEAVLSGPSGPANQLATALVHVLFEGKFFLLFSFLFGWGVQIQMQSAARSGQDLAPRYLRRMAGLAVLGVLHAVLVFTGDILFLYAVLGALVWPLRQWSPRGLIRLALGMLPVAVLGLALLAILIGAGLPEPENRALAEGFRAATQYRLTEWPSTLLFLILFQGPLAFGAILAGLAAAKTDFFRADSPGRLWLGRALPWLLVLGLPLNLLLAMAPVDDSLFALGGLLIFALAAPMLSAVYLHGLLWLGDRLNLPPVLTRSGQNSLTAYLLQGILAGLIFGGHGLGLFGQVGQAALLALAIATALLAMVLTGAMAGRWGRGPFEQLLRRLTYGRAGV